MADPSSSGLLTRMSASPSPSSSSSLTSSSSFDPHANPPPEDKGEQGPSTLGLRELNDMRRRDRRVRKAAKAGARAQREPEMIVPDSTRGGVKLVQSVIGGGTESPFAVDVQIKGWRVVGGKSWTDLGRIGAYVVYDIEVTLRSGGKISVLRRYTDFVNLRSALQDRYPAFRQAIPPLPGKAHMCTSFPPHPNPTMRKADQVARFNEKFLADRQPRLQRFLRGVMLHPEMGRAGGHSIVGQWIVNPNSDISDGS